jgi:hypothetical protein
MKNCFACDGCGCVVTKTKQYASARFCQACWWSRVPDTKGSNQQARVEALEAMLGRVVPELKEYADVLRDERSGQYADKVNSLTDEARALLEAGK